MPSIILLSAITGLAGLVLMGCSQSSPSTSTETRAPDSNINHAKGMMGGTANMPPTNRMTNINMPASSKATAADNDATR